MYLAFISINIIIITVYTCCRRSWSLLAEIRESVISESSNSNMHYGTLYTVFFKKFYFIISLYKHGRPSYKLRLDMEDLQFTKRYKMYPSFFHTKLCLLFSCLELSRRPERDDISVAMIDPSPFKSGLVWDVPLAGQAYQWAIMVRYKIAAQG